MSRRKKTNPSLSPDDEKLWQAVTTTVTPLEGRSFAPLAPRLKFEKPVSEQPLPAEWYQGTPSRPAAKLDRHMRRQIKTGRRPIGKTLDLHGMNQDQAFQALKSAIENAIRYEMRALIVVTGKGGARWAQSDAHCVSQRKRSDFDQFGGVLKRMVPLWLSSADLAPFVHSYSEASKEDGGAGALYVVLRTKPKQKNRPTI